MIDTCIFDLGNVIVNYDFNIAVNKLVEVSSQDKENILGIIRKSGLIKKFDKGKLTEIEFFETVKNELEICISFENFKSIWTEIFTVNKQVYNLVKVLKDKGYCLVLLSNTNKIHFEYIEENYNIAELFDEIFLSYETGFLKTEKDAFNYLKRKLKIKPENCIFIDDKRENLRFAEEIGINCILYKNYDGLIFKLSEFGINVT